MTGSDLRFSIIMPVYNGQAFIANAINSCLQQTELPHEIMVIDDASTDDTASIVHGFNSLLVKYFRNEKNSGPSFSRNKGIREAKGEWLLFLDADDIFHPEKIKIIRGCVERNTAIKAIGHSFDVAGSKEKNIRPAQVITPKKINPKDVLLKNPVVTPALAVAAQNNVLFNEEMSYAEDHDFILRTAEQYGLWFIDLPLCSLQRMPLTAGGQSSNKWRMRKGEMKMYVDYCKRHGWYFAIPALLLFSLLKHTKQMMFTNKSAAV